MDYGEQTVYSIYLALIVAVPAIISPIIMSWLTHRHRRQERADDYARQDLVAQRVANMAQEQRIAATRAANVASEQRAVAEVATASRDRQETQLKQIHALVNSAMTAAIEEKLALAKRGLVLLLEIVNLRQQLQVKPTEEALAEIAAAKAQIADLELVLADRSRQAELARAQAEETKES